jgi:SAM-dependent methyltransferase
LTVEPFVKYDIGGAYHWKWYILNYEGYRDFTNALVNLVPNPGRVLDVGCGDGLISYLFFRSGCDVVGFDTSETAIKLANIVSEMAVRNSMGADIADVQNTPFVQGDRTEMLQRLKHQALQYSESSIYDFNEPNSFDFAICSEVIEHMEFPQLLLEKVHHAIRQYAIITTPNGLLPDGTMDKPGSYDYHVWSPETFAELLDGYNFEFLDLKPGTIAVKLYK